MPVSLIGYDVLGLISLIIIGLIIILLVHPVLILVPAVSIAFMVWYLAGNISWAGIAFLVIAALSILKKL